MTSNHTHRGTSALCRPALGAVAFAMFALPALAQGPDANAQGPADADNDPYRLLSTIVVTGSSDNAAEVAGSVSFLTDADLSVQAQSDVLRVLRAVPGVNIQEEDGFGLRPNIGLRGSGSDRSARVALMEDGVPIAPAPYASPAAYYFPTMTRISAVEVTKGPAVVRYGPRTTGGAINLFSTPVPETVSGFGQVFFGDFGRQRLHVWTGGRDEIGGTRVKAGGLIEFVSDRSDGFKVLDSGGNTGFEADDIVVKLGLYDEAAAMPQSLEFKYQRRNEVSDETYLGLTREDYDANPLRRYDASRNDVFEGGNELYQLTHKIDVSPRLSLTSFAYQNDFGRNWYKLEGVAAGGNGAAGDVGLSAILDDPLRFAAELDLLTGAASLDDSLVFRANRRAFLSRGVQSVLAFETQLGGLQHELTVGVRYHEDSEDRFQEDDAYRLEGGRLFLTSAGARGSQTNRVSEGEALAIFIEDRITFGRFALKAGARFEDYTLTRLDYSTSDPARLNGPTRVRALNDSVIVPGVSVLYDASANWTLLAGVHRGFAIAGPGTTRAEAEESWNYEAGARFDRGPAGFEVIAFFNDYSNLLGTCTASSGGDCVVGDQFDGGEVDVSGIELTAQYDAGAWLGGAYSVPLGLVYTYTQTEFRTSFASSYGPWGTVDAGDELPYVPEQQLTLLAGIEADRWGANLSANYVSEARAIAGQGDILAAQSIDARWLTDAAIWFDVNDQLRLRAKVENLFDETYLASLSPSGLRPGKPQEVSFGLEVRF